MAEDKVLLKWKGRFTKEEWNDTHKDFAADLVETEKALLPHLRKKEMPAEAFNRIFDLKEAVLAKSVAESNVKKLVYKIKLYDELHHNTKKGYHNELLPAKITFYSPKITPMHADAVHLECDNPYLEKNGRGKFRFISDDFIDGVIINCNRIELQVMDKTIEIV